jgi:hypothetical protein
MNELPVLHRNAYSKSSRAHCPSKEQRRGALKIIATGAGIGLCGHGSTLHRTTLPLGACLHRINSDVRP